MSDLKIADAVAAFLADRVRPLAGDDVLTMDEPLLSNGRLDSLNVLELVAFLEERFDIRIHAHEVDRQHLNTIRSIERMVMGKLAER